MPTDWEANYQKNETPWDKGAPSPGLVDFLAAEPIRGRVLVPGCGFGYDVRALAATADEVVGLDIAPSAVKGARTFPSVGGERYELANFFALPLRLHGCFDWVWEHTCFCAIDPAMRPAYVAAVASALRPGRTFTGGFLPRSGPGSSRRRPAFRRLCRRTRRAVRPAFHAAPGMAAAARLCRGARAASGCGCWARRA